MLAILNTMSPVQIFIDCIILKVLSPEDCQNVCAKEQSCVAMTWLNADVPLYPLTCALFNQVSLTLKNQFANSLRKTSTVTTPCEECVSGPPNCSCSIQGDCKRNLHDHQSLWKVNATSWRTTLLTLLAMLNHGSCVTPSAVKILTAMYSPTSARKIISGQICEV